MIVSSIASLQRVVHHHGHPRIADASRSQTILLTTIKFLAALLALDSVAFHSASASGFAPHRLAMRTRNGYLVHFEYAPDLNCGL